MATRLTGAPPSRPTALERLLVAALSAAFFRLAMFRDGAFVYLFHKTSSGVWIDEGVRVAGGELMYRDFFETIAPGIVHLDAALAWALGDGVNTFAYAGLGVGVALATVLHALSGRCVASRWRLLPPLLFAVFVYPPLDLGHPRWPALLLTVAAIFTATGGTGLGRWSGAGVALGFAALFAPEIGLGAGLGLTVALLVSRPRRRGEAAGLCLGIAAPIAAVISIFAASAGPARLLEAVSLGPRLGAFDRHAWLIPWGARPASHLLVALASLAAGVVLLARPAPDAAPRGLRDVSAAGLGLLAASVLGAAAPDTLATHAILLFVALAHELDRLDASASRRWLARGALALLMPGLVHGSLGLVIRRQWVDPMVRQHFRAGDAWIGAPTRELEWLENRLRPGDYTFVFPAGGHAYTLTRTRNATSFGCLVEGWATEDQQRQALAEIAARRPAVGVWFGAQRIPHAARSLDTLYAGLLRDYEVETALPNRSLLLRRRAADAFLDPRGRAVVPSPR